MPQNGINKQTNNIILSKFEDVMIKGNKSSKLVKAEKMITQAMELFYFILDFFIIAFFC